MKNILNPDHAFTQKPSINHPGPSGNYNMTKKPQRP
jgi:hypothetical protein